MNGHAPVMLDEAMEALALRDGAVYVDATLGDGGYTKAMLGRCDCRVFAFDLDPTALVRALDWAPAFGSRLVALNRPFAEMEEGLAENGQTSIDGVAFDLGVSSMQLDDPSRGFSFRFDGPLSMRMDQGEPDASTVVNNAQKSELAAIFRIYGEERHAARIASAIVAERSKQPIATTGRLAAIVAAAARTPGKDKIHPATRVFQALRIYVNDELGQLARGLVAAEKLLRPAGRLVVVSFHSLEDRIVKRFIADRASKGGGPSRHAPERAIAPPTLKPLFSGARTPSHSEVERNPRARSAKLRAAVRLEASARSDMSAFAPPQIAVSGIGR